MLRLSPSYMDGSTSHVNAVALLFRSSLRCCPSTPPPLPLILSDSYPWMLPSRALGLHWICLPVISSTSSFIGEPLHARELSGVKLLFDGYNWLKGWKRRLDVRALISSTTPFLFRLRWWTNALPFLLPLLLFRPQTMDWAPSDWPFGTSSSTFSPFIFYTTSCP